MARVISVFLPLWPTDRLRRQADDTAPSPDAPLILAGRVGSRRVVTAAKEKLEQIRATLPPGVEVVGIVRDGSVRLPRPDLRLTATDELVFLARPDAYTALEGVLRLPGA